MGAAPQQKPKNSHPGLYLEGQDHVLRVSSKFSFGRNQTFSDASVSVKHFTIAQNAAGIYYIMDEGSRSGTCINGIQLPPKKWAELREGHRVTAGCYTFTFSWGPSTPEAIEKLSETPDSAKDADYTGDHKNDNTFLAGMASLNIIAYAFLLFGGGELNDIAAPLLSKFGGNLPYLTTGGQWWRLFTAPFMHASFMHLFGNVLALYFAMAHIIRYLTPNKIIAVYLGSAFFASVASAMFVPLNTVSVGASGAIFGLYGSLIVCIVWYRKRGIKINNWLIATALQFAVQNIGLGVKGVDAAAHIGGFFAGILITLLCLELLPEDDRKSTRKLFGIFAVVILCVVLIMPARKLSARMQMEPLFAQYVDMMGTYYKNHKLLGRTEDIALYQEYSKQIDGNFNLFIKKVKEIEPVDEEAALYKGQILYVVDMTKNHAHHINQYLVAGKIKDLNSAKNIDKNMGKLIHKIAVEMGMPDKKINAFEKSERRPAQKPRTSTRKKPAKKN